MGMVMSHKPFRPLRLLAAVILALGVVSTLIAGPAFAFVHDHVYPAPHAPVSVEGMAPGVVVITVKAADGLAIKGLEIAAKPGMPTLLVLHGNGSSAMDTMLWFAPLIADGYGVVAADYREYSGNPGRASEAGLAMDADAFYAQARTLAGAGRLIVVGHSLGGGVAFGLSRRQHLDALVTIDTFTRLLEMVPAFGRVFVSDRYDNAAALTVLDEPYFLIHGTADPTVPFTQGQALANAAIAAHKSGAAFMIEGAGHGPDPDTLAMIIRAVAAKLATPPGQIAKVQLPAYVKLTPFGP